MEMTLLSDNCFGPPPYPLAFLIPFVVACALAATVIAWQAPALLAWAFPVAVTKGVLSAMAVSLSLGGEAPYAPVSYAAISFLVMTVITGVTMAAVVLAVRRPQPHPPRLRRPVHPR